MRNPGITFALAVLFAPACPLSSQDGAGDQKPEPNARAVGGAVALVHRGAKPVVDCAVSGDGSTTVMCTADDMLHFFHLADHFSGDEKRIGKNDKAFPYRISRAALTFEGDRLFGLIDPSTLGVFGKSPRILHSLRGNAGLADYALNVDGKNLATGLRGGLVRFWDIETGKPYRYFQAHDKDIRSVAFSADGSKLITAAADNTIRFFNFPDCRKLGEVAVEDPVLEMCVARDGKTLVSYGEKAAQVWDLTRLAAGRKFPMAGGIACVGVSPDGKQLAIAETAGAIALFDLESGKQKVRWDAHPGHKVVCLGFVEPRKGRKLLVSAAGGDDVVYWEIDRIGKPDKPDKKKGRQRRR